MKNGKVLILFVLSILLLVFAIFNYSSKTRQVVDKEREQIFIDFVEGRDVPLNKAFWLFEGMGPSLSPTETLLFCKNLGIDDWEYVWNNLKDFHQQTIKYTGETMSIEKLRARPTPK